MDHCTYWEIKGYNFKIYFLYFWEDQFFIANSADPDEMLHYVAFHLGLHCLLCTRLGVYSL